MSVFLIATLEVRPGHFPQFVETMAKIAGIVEANGWKLAGAYTHRTGQLNTVIDIWELPDMNAMQTGMGAVAGSPEFAAISAVLAEAVTKETLTFADRLFYPGREG